MRFMMIIKSNEQAESGRMPDEKLLSAMGTYNQELIKANALLAGEGLHASSKGFKVRKAGKTGKTSTVVDGPFAEAKELVGGFWIIKVASKEEAIAWARRVPVKDGEIELRQLFEMEDFPQDPAEQAGGWRDQEEQMRAAAEAPATAPARRPGTRRWMAMIKSDARSEAGVMPSEKTLTEMGALMQEMGTAGVALGGEGLQPTAKGARVRVSGEKRTVIDGPFSEAKELIAGYCILQTATREEAVEWVKRWADIHHDSGAEQTEIEVRPLVEMSDFAVDAAEKPDGWRAQEQSFRDRTGQ
jgi:hypothetical protein